MEDKAANRRKNKLSLIGLFLIFLSPILFAVFYMYFPDEERGFKNKGQLLAQPVPMPEVSLYEPYEKKEIPLKGKWNLVFLSEGFCDEECLVNMYKIRQIRLAMSKHDQRVQRVAVMDSTDSSLYENALTDEYKGQLILPLDSSEEDIISLFKQSENDLPYEKNRIYIIDPLGNLMMSYEADADPIGIIEDLRVLIKASRIG